MTRVFTFVLWQYNAVTYICTVFVWWRLFKLICLRLFDSNLWQSSYCCYYYCFQELREAFEDESRATGRARLLLTIAVPAGIETIDKGFDIPSINR